MSTHTVLLPAGFEDLEVLASEWCLKGQRARYERMLASDMDTLRAFYDAVLPRLEEIVGHLKKFSLDDMPPAESALMDLALTFAEVAHPVDLNWKSTVLPAAFPIARVDLTGASQEW